MAEPQIVGATGCAGSLAGIRTVALKGPRSRLLRVPLFTADWSTVDANLTLEIPLGGLVDLPTSSALLLVLPTNADLQWVRGAGVAVIVRASATDFNGRIVDGETILRVDLREGDVGVGVGRLLRGPLPGRCRLAVECRQGLIVTTARMDLQIELLAS